MWFLKSTSETERLFYWERFWQLGFERTLVLVRMLLCVRTNLVMSTNPESVCSGSSLPLKPVFWRLSFDPVCWLRHPLNTFLRRWWTTGNPTNSYTWPHFAILFTTSYFSGFRYGTKPLKNSQHGVSFLTVRLFLWERMFPWERLLSWERMLISKG